MEIFDPKRPFNGLPPLPPKADIETRQILKKCIEARSALAELKQVGELIPNQTILINTIPLREAKDSSEIENIVTTADNLFRYAGIAEDKADAATKETLRYRAALFEGYKNLEKRPLTTATAVTVCQRIRNVALDIRDTPGTALKNAATNDVIYTPPEGQSTLREKLANWEIFLHDHGEVDPLIRMAVGHYQFEAIHPFTDGNGRTGRILNILFLIGEGLLDIPVLYLSRHIIRNKDDYYRLILDVTAQGAWEPWILYMLTAVEETAKWTTRKIRAIKQLIDHTSAHVRANRSKIYSRQLVETTFIQPYCRIANLVEAGIARRQTASKYLKELCAIGILREIEIGREKLFVHPKFIELLMSDESEFEKYGAAEAR